jgi:uncharacterized protein YkwD
MGSTCRAVDAPAAELTLDEFDASVFCRINRRRAEYGRRPLSPNPVLHRAVNYASSLLQGRFFSHHGVFGGRPTGSRVIGRPRQTATSGPATFGSWAENFHWTTADRSTPANVVQAWMDSAVHWMYLLEPNFEELGVAAVPGVPLR